MTETEVKETLLKLLRRAAPEADLSSLSPDANIRATLDIDSYDFLMFLIALDENLGVSVPEADYGQLVSLNDVVRYVASHGVQMA